MNESDFIPYATSTTLGSGKVLVFAPHPDDEVFGCTAALLQHVAAGDPVRVIIVTDGAWQQGIDYAETRRQESAKAAEMLGYDQPQFWNLPDRSLQYGEWLIERIQSSIDEYGGEFVYAPSSREIHPDHRAIALATAEAVRRCARPVSLVMYEVGVPLHPNRLLDLTAAFELKQAAMGCFASQLAQQRYDLHVAALNCFRTYTLPKSVAAAEAYRIVTRDELRADPIGSMRQDRIAPAGWSPDSSVGLPLVSVIIRSLDRPSLRTTLDSVALQTYPHIEILVVASSGRDHSTVADWLGRFRVRLISASAPLSRSRAANLGIDQTRGQYLTILDDVCTLHPQHIAALTDTLRKFPWHMSTCSPTFLPGQARGHSVIRTEQLCAHGGIPLHAALFDRELISRGCRFDESLAEHEDWDFLFQVAQMTPLLVAEPALESGGEKPNPPAAGGGTSGARGPLYEKWRHFWSGTQWAAIVSELELAATSAGHDGAMLTGGFAECLVNARQQQHAEVAAQMDSLRNQLADQAAELARIRNLLAETEAVGQRLAADNQALAAWATGLDVALDDLRGSASWRATRPLRFVSRLLRGRFRKAPSLNGRQPRSTR